MHFESPYPKSDIIRGIRWISKPWKYPGSHGDVWTCTWANDGHLYTAADDAFGIDRSCYSNLSIQRIEGMPGSLHVTTVNPMFEYGTLGQRDGFDSWKAMGLTSVDGILFMTVSQHSSASDYPDRLQRTYDASIIKSTDYGKTWSCKKRDPMFGTGRFSTPMFVEFGQDYQGAFDDYIYAVSSGGTWNNGNYMTLGRVHRNKIGDLDSGDWEMFSELAADGTPRWQQYARTTDGQTWPAIFQCRGFTSMTGMHYVPAANRFLLPQWAYADLDSSTPWKTTMFHLYESERPWGPWRAVHTESDFGRAWYNPGFPSKWFQDGGQRLWMTVAGDFASHHVPDQGEYGLILQELELLL